jgi:lysophospholipase L1-like esterase
VDTARLARGTAGGLAATATVGAGVMLAQVWVAARRPYQPAASAPSVDGEFGEPGAPPLRLVILGDSTGAGVGVTRTLDTVGAALARRLAGAGRRVRLAGVAIAGSGSGDLGPQVSRALLGRPDVAVLLVGTTDATRGTSLGAVRQNLGDAVRRLRSAGVAVVVGTCPDLGASRAFRQPLRSVVAWRGRRVGAASAATTLDAGGVPVDLATETGPVFRADPGTYCADGFHPSADGYRLYAEALLGPVSEAAADPTLRSF